MFRFFIAAVLISCSSIAQAADTGPLCRVVRDDGRVLSGTLDARTDAAALWLQHREGSMAISFSIPWNQIESARLGNKRLSGKKLRNAALKRRPVRKLSYLDLLANASPSPAAPRQIATPPKPTHIEAFAQTTNWNADAARDGVELSLTARDASNQAVATRGVLRAALRGFRKPHPARAGEWVKIGTWSQLVRADQFDEFGQLTVRLPYQSRHPDRQSGYGRDAILDVQFQPHRSGPLEASITLGLRDFEFIRDFAE